MSAAAPEPHSPVPAGFLLRCTAWSLDMTALGAIALLACATRVHEGSLRIATALDALSRLLAQGMLDMVMRDDPPLDLARQWLADPRQREAVAALADAIGDASVPPLLLTALLALAWFSLFESSRHQATPGKRLLGLRVVDVAAARISPARAALRHLAGSLSWLSLNLGHLLALVPPQRQALHDRLAGTCVVQDRAEVRLPAWARAWLALLGVAAVLLTVWGFVAVQASMQRAFDALL